VSYKVTAFLQRIYARLSPSDLAAMLKTFHFLENEMSITEGDLR
jgi:hypothetical protein